MDDETKRLYLHHKLTQAFPNINVYYRPPRDLVLSRPCIVYDLQTRIPSWANNKPFVIGAEYQLTYLSDSPGDGDSERVLDLEGVTVRPGRTFVDQEVVHDIFTIIVNAI